MEEYELPNPDKAIQAVIGNAKMVADEPLFYGEGVCRQVIVYNDAMDEILNAYEQVFTFETKEWVAISLWEGFEREGTMYSRIGRMIPSLNGKLYCLVTTREGEDYLATFGADGVGEIIGTANALRQRIIEMENAQVFLDDSGNTYLYENTGIPLAGTDLTQIIAFDSTMQEQWQREDSGWIYGAVQKEEHSEVSFYGSAEEGKITVWQGNGERNFLNGTEEIKEEFLITYLGKEFWCVNAEKALWLVGEEGMQKLFDFNNEGYYAEEVYGIRSLKEDRVQLLVQLDGELLLLTGSITKQKPSVEKQEITIAFGMQNASLNAVIAGFNRQSREYCIKTLLPESDEDDVAFRNRIQLEISAGRGPDMLEGDVILKPEAMVQNGYLECMEDWGFDETGCVASAFEQGRISGKLYAIPYDFMIDYVAYRGSDVEGKSTLTMEELMNKVQESDAKLLQEDFSGEMIVIKYALSDDSNTDYIDWNHRRSHLTEQPFMDLLAFAKEYGDTKHSEQSLDREEIFAVGSFLRGTVTDFGMKNFQQIAQVYDTFGEEPVFLGYPRKEGNGIYVLPHLIYVNSQSEKKEGAIAFLKYLISEQSQIKYVEYDYDKDRPVTGELFANCTPAFPVNKAALEVLLENERRRSQKDMIYTGFAYTEEQFEQFRFMVEHSRAVPYNITAIQAMLEEELMPYFEGDVTAQHAAEILNNRVQLYINEWK
ncbi:MAG: ABC transporter substrate-binding protein [Roseburia sp.]|nr:ABC transporter substrate-binding protein [Roseburia sp.]